MEKESEFRIFIVQNNKPKCERCGKEISRGCIHCIRCWHLLRGHKLHKIAEKDNLFDGICVRERFR